MSKVYHLAIILVFAALGGMIVPAWAIPPLEQFAFQGVLKDNSGNLITGTRNIGLRLYTVYSGHTATNDANCLKPFCLWTENHTGVAISSGIFTIDAGSINSLSKAINFTNALYLEVIIRNSTAGDQVLTPRLNVTAAPFAFAAEKASTDLNLNKKQIINASNIYASGVINGITINNSTQAVSGISSLQVSMGTSVIGSISNTGLVNGSGIQIQNSGSTVNLITSTNGLTIQSDGSKVGSISSAGVVNGSSIQIQKGTSVIGSISNTGLVNGSSIQVKNGASTYGISSTGAITAATSTNTINGIIVNSGAISGVTTLSTSGNITTSNGLIISGGHLVTTGPTPAITGCGTPSIFGTDNAGNFTINTNSLTAICTITFKSKWSDDPVCLVNDQASGGGRLGVRSSNQTAITISTGGASGVTGDLANYICVGAK
ncbi:MAG: hypothetical protein KGI27_13700 [Thaumarchaeota archaeon]|nr:hypothetical protein [Nitrososphaerota archaeon]